MINIKKNFFFSQAVNMKEYSKCTFTDLALFSDGLLLQPSSSFDVFFLCNITVAIFLLRRTPKHFLVSTTRGHALLCDMEELCVSICYSLYNEATAIRNIAVIPGFCVTTTSVDMWEKEREREERGGAGQTAAGRSRIAGGREGKGKEKEDNAAYLRAKNVMTVWPMDFTERCAN
jgi:hypothetical protein